MKKLRDSLKISLIGSQPAYTTCKNKYSNAANIITGAVETTFCSMFLKYASYRNGLNSSWHCSMCLNSRFWVITWSFPLFQRISSSSFDTLGAYHDQPSEAASLSHTSLEELNSRSRTMDRVQPLFFKCLSSDAIVTFTSA